MLSGQVPLPTMPSPQPNGTGGGGGGGGRGGGLGGRGGGEGLYQQAPPAQLTPHQDSPVPHQPAREQHSVGLGQMPEPTTPPPQDGGGLGGRGGGLGYWMQGPPLRGRGLGGTLVGRASKSIAVAVRGRHATSYQRPFPRSTTTYRQRGPQNASVVPQ